MKKIQLPAMDRTEHELWAVSASEIRNLTWGQVDFEKRFLTVGKSKTEAGQGRTIPLNSVLLPGLWEHSKWYTKRFGVTRPERYVFPGRAGKPSAGEKRPLDPSLPVTSLKTAWRNVKERAGVKGRWHDARHTLVTELAESGAGDQTIMNIAGHVSRNMLKHYSHIRMEAKRKALESIVTTAREKQDSAAIMPETSIGVPKNSPKVDLVN